MCPVSQLEGCRAEMWTQLTLSLCTEPAHPGPTHTALELKLWVQSKKNTFYQRWLKIKQAISDQVEFIASRDVQEEAGGKVGVW